MSEISQKEVIKIAKLSRIEIKNEQIPEIQNKLKKILNWVEVLEEVNTENVEPLYNVHQMTMPMAKDEISDGNKVDEILANAPNPVYNYFATPKVIE